MTKLHHSENQVQILTKAQYLLLLNNLKEQLMLFVLHPVQVVSQRRKDASWCLSRVCVHLCLRTLGALPCFL